MDFTRIPSDWDEKKNAGKKKPNEKRKPTIERIIERHQVTVDKATAQE